MVYRRRLNSHKFLTINDLTHMKNLLVFLLITLLCSSVQGATLEFAFQLGVKQEPAA